MTRYVTIAIRTVIVLDNDQVWSDKNSPPDFTADDVKQEMERYGTKAVTLRDWNLLHDPVVDVKVDGNTVRVWDR